MKAARSFLEISHWTYEHNILEMQKNPDYEMGKKQI